MRGAIYILLFLMMTLSVAALSNPVTYNGKTYYVVNSADSTEDTGAEVCAKAGLVCNGYTEPTDAVCKQFNPSAASASGWAGDQSGVYCNGAPQGGVCNTLQNTCSTCPQCSTSVDCKTEIGGLYNQMFVECGQPTQGQSCSVHIAAKGLNQLMNDIPGINAQLQGCPQKVPSGTGLVFSSGETQVDVKNNNGGFTQFTITINGGSITGIKAGAASSCKQKVDISENDLNSILSSSNGAGTVSYLVSQKKIKVSGCNFISSTRLFFVNPIANWFVKRQAPATPPPPPPAPNCGNYGEQCNNRGCFSGLCGAPEERNSNGQWGNWNYRCLDQREYQTYCIGRGNTPPAWACTPTLACR